MALTIEIEVSTSGWSNAAFSPLTTVPDDPGGYFFAHTDAPAVVYGVTYIYRARRRDDSLPDGSQYSDWSDPYAVARIPYPPRGLQSMDAEDIVTGVESAVYVGTEMIPGLPAKVTDQGAFLTGGLDRDLGRVFSQTLRNKPTMRRKVVAGIVTYQGSITVEISPEGFYPRLLNAVWPVTTSTLSSPTRYLHRWSNDFGSLTVTVVIRKGDTFFVYPGSRVTNYTATQAAEGDTVAEATFDLLALDELVYELASVPGILSDLGISGASEDAFPGYSQQDAELLVGNAIGGLRSLTFTVAKNLGRRKVGDGKRGATGSFERRAETSGSASAYYEDNANLYRDFGLATPPTTGFAAGCSIVTAPVKSVMTPCIPSGYTFAPVLTHYFPAADVRTATPIGGPDEVPENLTFAPIDEIGNSENTDALITLENSETGAELVAPSAPFVGTTSFEATTKSRVKNYDHGVLTGTPTTTTFIVAANAYLHSTTTVDDDYYNGRKIKMLTGTEKGVEHTVTDYVASTRTFTVTPAFSIAPVAGDVVGII